MSAMLETMNLKKYFHTPHGLLHAVDGVSFEIDAGHTLGIVGESGCGKSTLGRLIVHLLDATDGRIFFNGKDITKPPKSDLKALHINMQMMFQDPFSSLNPRMTVSETIAEPLKCYGCTKIAVERNKRVLKLMDTVGLTKRLSNSYPHELDGGRRQRIGIARALALNPEFIVCDEPVSALDVSIQAQILNLMMDLQDEKKLTYMFITHDLSVVKHISNDIGVMYLGMMVEKCPTKELFKRRLHPYTKALISAIPTTDIDNPPKRVTLKGEIVSPIDPPEACRFAPRCPYAEERCRANVPQIEEVFEGHFTACFRVREINKL